MRKLAKRTPAPLEAGALAYAIELSYSYGSCSSAELPSASLNRTKIHC